MSFKDSSEYCLCIYIYLVFETMGINYSIPPNESLRLL